MSKYSALEKFLQSKGHERIPMSFSDIEDVIHDSLPPSARKHRAWWSNNPSNSVITYAWLAAGYRTAEVNLEGEKVTFVRNEDAKVHRPSDNNETAGRRSVFGCMKGTITVPEGVDLTEPAMPEWAKMTEKPAIYNE